jgi:hypothetical protein
VLRNNGSYKYKNVDTVDNMILTYSWLKFVDAPLATVYVVCGCMHRNIKCWSLQSKRSSPFAMYWCVSCKRVLCTWFCINYMHLLVYVCDYTKNVLLCNYFPLLSWRQAFILWTLFFFFNFSKSLLVNAANSLLIMFKAVQVLWDIAVDSFCKKSPQKNVRWRKVWESL